MLPSYKISEILSWIENVIQFEGSFTIKYFQSGIMKRVPLKVLKILKYQIKMLLIWFIVFCLVETSVIE